MIGSVSIQSDIYNNIDLMPPSYDEIMQQNKVIMIKNEQESEVPLPTLPYSHIEVIPNTSKFNLLDLFIFVKNF